MTCERCLEDRTSLSNRVVSDIIDMRVCFFCALEALCHDGPVGTMRLESLDDPC